MRRIFIYFFTLYFAALMILMPLKFRTFSLNKPNKKKKKIYFHRTYDDVRSSIRGMAVRDDLIRTKKIHFFSDIISFYDFVPYLFSS